MFQIRKHIFETNSSSTHSFIMCTKDDFNKLEKGKLLINEDDTIVTIEEATKYAVDYVMKHPTWFTNSVVEFAKSIKDKSEYQIVKWLEDNDLAVTLDTYLDNDYLETFSQEFTTPGGETVVVFGKYGYEG